MRVKRALQRRDDVRREGALDAARQRQERPIGLRQRARRRIASVQDAAALGRQQVGKLGGETAGGHGSSIALFRPAP